MTFQCRGGKVGPIPRATTSVSTHANRADEESVSRLGVGNSQDFLENRLSKNIRGIEDNLINIMIIMKFDYLTCNFITKVL